MGTEKLLQQFKTLHEQKYPLVLGNVWDAHTAILAEKAGFKALGTSSHAIAFAMGYEDGEEISFDELLFVVERTIKAVKIPVSVDFESGYSDDPEQVAEYVVALEKVGAVGINLEDGQVEDGVRQLGSSQLLVDKIRAIKKKSNLFINARTDTYTTKHSTPLEETIERARQYQAAGADGIFVPLIETKKDIQTFIEQVALPLNVFTTPKLPPYEELAELGVKRISHGAKHYDQVLKISEGIFNDFIKSKDYKVVLG